MMRATLALALVAAAAANICTTPSGTWSFGIADGVTDYAHANVALNKSYYCFEGCLATANVVQNYKVILSGSAPRIDRSRSLADVQKRLRDGDDPNADSCEDPVLRADIAAALTKVTSHTAKGIAQAIQYNVNRPGWCINVVKFDAFSLDSIYQDMNFCDYDTYMLDEIYNIRMAAIDFS